MSRVADKLPRIAKSALLCGLLATAAPALAADFVSAATPTFFYDAPSLKAKKLFAVTRYLPLEQMVVLDNWVKVRDSSGKLYWVEKRALSSKRFVEVTSPVATVRANPDSNSAVVFQATQQLALEWLGGTGDGWLRVSHTDGATGYIKISDVWGD